MSVTVLSRRSLLRSGLLAAGTLAFGDGLYRNAFAAAPATPGPGPYGALRAPDEHGLALPAGFRSRLVALGGAVVAGTGYRWHGLTDGQGTFPLRGGGWILVANAEVGGGQGGASSITFGPDGSVRGARRILTGTSRNCSGGATPWGTWLSCEEHAAGLTWECDPTGRRAAVARPALGTFCHESACVDPGGRRLYLTEDEPDGCLYRFTPARWPDLGRGRLEVARVGSGGAVTWARVPAPNATDSVPTRHQVAGAARFAGGEGMWCDSGTVYFTTKGDRRVWALHTAAARLEVLYDRERAGAASPLREVDNVCVARSGDVYVCEDGDDFAVCVITPERRVSAVVRLDPAVHGAPGSNETTGVVFDPSGSRLYLGVQRSFGVGAVYEVRGPFHGATSRRTRRARARRRRGRRRR